MTFNINWDQYGVYVKFRGIVTAQDLIDANNYLISNKNFEDINYQIFDFINIDGFNITKEDIQIVGTMDKSQSDFKKEMKVAIVTQDNKVRDITAEYEQLMEGSRWKTKIFDDVDNARKWCLQK